MIRASTFASILKYALIFSLIASCSGEKTESLSSVGSNGNSSPLLFQLLEESHTNISFSNKLVETNLMNALNYDYMYNGAGVSVGDFNQDGLADLYFVSNQFPNQLYLNRGDFKFEDVTKISATGGREGFSTGTTIVDINADGLLDIYVCRSGAFEEAEKRKNELFVNQGNNENGIPIFKEEANKYQLDLAYYSTQASFFDYDKDGDLDLFLINHNVNSEVHYALNKYRTRQSAETSDRLFRNDNSTFMDVSEEAGVINDGIGFGLGLAIGDLNNDNWPDVVVGQDFASKDRIYLNLQNGTFQEISEEATGHLSNFSMGNDIADFNNDGWLDFMSLDMVSEDNYGIKASMSGMNPEQFHKRIKQGLHHQYMYNTLQINNGTANTSNIPYFSDIAELAGVSSTDWSWGPLFFDMDNDGDKDLFISNGIKRDFRNVDYLHYRERAEKEYLEKVKKASPKLKALIKQQHDTDLIRLMPPRKKSNYFYENNGPFSFDKRNDSWVLEKMDASNGAAYADLDNDGDLDLVTNNMDDLASVYRNNSTELGLGNFIKIKLDGPEKNPNGIGARVRITTRNNTQISEQYVSRGFQSSVENILHFGLGTATAIQEIRITWPDGKIQILQPDQINQTLRLSYTAAEAAGEKATPPSPIFTTITATSGLNHFAPQNDFDDFKRESLLPHKLSQEGPALAVGDINKDGLDDFYLGGAKGYPGRLFVQDANGKFESKQTVFQDSKPYEEVDAVFFDADQDGDLDLYVVSGSNEYELGSKFYEDRIYSNENGQFKRVSEPFNQQFAVSGSVVRPNDFDLDGDLDLFIGGRQLPGQYPHAGTSLLLRNDSEPGSIRFTRIEEKLLDKLGMVTDANWADVDGDAIKDLIIVGEWMPITILKNSGSTFTDFTQNTDLEKETGWWFSVETADFDQDGDMDIIAGNLGLNSKYKASPTEPFQVFAKDFDQTGTLDIVLGYHQDGERFPLRGRECSSNQMPFIKEKFPDYHSFASATIEAIYGAENLAESLHFNATNFATSYLENTGSGQFKMRPLPNAAQFTAIRKIITADVNKDGHLDALLFGNNYGFEVETPRQDAGYGMLLLGNGKGDFKPLMPYDSGLFVKGEVADAALIAIANKQRAFLIAKNNDYLQLLISNDFLY